MAHTALYKLYCIFYHIYYTNSLTALLLLLMWSLSSALPLHQCTLCASYSMRIIEWISICGTYVRTWLGDTSKHTAVCQLQRGCTYCKWHISLGQWHKLVATPVDNSVSIIIIPYIWTITIIIQFWIYFYLSVGFCDVCGQQSSGRVCNFHKRAAIMCFIRWQVGQCLQKRPVSIHVGGIRMYVHA